MAPARAPVDEAWWAPHRVAAVDWSGAKNGAARHLWIAEWDPARTLVCSVVPASREDAVVYLCDLADRDDRALVGLDFNFSFPEWWLDTCAIEDPRDLWNDEARLEEWLAACAPPFWGRPGCPRPPMTQRQQFRATELAVEGIGRVGAGGAGGGRRPKSVFQIGGAGSVGTGSLRGMPALARLARTGFAIWPFDDCSAAAGAGASSDRPAVAEVWPRLAAPTVIKSRASARHAWLEQHAALLAPGVAALAGASDDAFDAVAAVIGLASRGRAVLVCVQDPVVRREGWIAGVPFP